MATLFVVATPIGNLEDLSPRAARILGESPVVAAESVQRTRALLTRLGAGHKKIISCREANRRRAAAQVLGHLAAGREVALVSDAGTPGICDPASAVVDAALAAGYPVSPVPGPSALAALLSVSGLDNPPLVFLGFPPAKPGPRKKLLGQAADTGWPVALYEAPHRLGATARDLAEVWGDAPVVMAREVSKLHEEISRSSCVELAARAAQQEIKGEVALLVLPTAEQQGGAAIEEAEVDRLLAQGLARGDEPPAKLARRVARETAWPRDVVYKKIMALKGG